jgi:hypothetical protein
MAAVLPFKKNYVPRVTIAPSRHLDPLPIEAGYGNRSGDHAISTQSNQPRYLGSKRCVRLISRPLDTQRPTSAIGRFHFVNLILGKADEVDTRVSGKIVKAKRLLGQLSCYHCALSLLTLHGR